MEIPAALTTTLARYLNSLKARNTSAHTITAYRTDVTQFFTWLAENDITVTTPQHISRSHLIDYLSYLADRGRSGVTRARKLVAICHLTTVPTNRSSGRGVDEAPAD